MPREEVEERNRKARKQQLTVEVALPQVGALVLDGLGAVVDEARRVPDSLHAAGTAGGEVHSATHRQEGLHSR